MATKKTTSANDSTSKQKSPDESKGKSSSKTSGKSVNHVKSEDVNDPTGDAHKSSKR